LSFWGSLGKRFGRGDVCTLSLILCGRTHQMNWAASMSDACKSSSFLVPGDNLKPGQPEHAFGDYVTCSYYQLDHIRNPARHYKLGHSCTSKDEQMSKRNKGQIPVSTIKIRGMMLFGNEGMTSYGCVVRVHGGMAAGECGCTESRVLSPASPFCLAGRLLLQGGVLRC
jgi:hypothetical protein